MTFSKIGTAVVTYEDVTLDALDVSLLDPPNWLNDNVISFYGHWISLNKGFLNSRTYFSYPVPSSSSSISSSLLPSIPSDSSPSDSTHNFGDDINCTSIVFLPPNIVFFIGLCTDENDVAHTLSSFHLDQAEIVLIPVNNSSDMTATQVSGDHWSLVVFARNQKKDSYLHQCFLFPPSEEARESQTKKNIKVEDPYQPDYADGDTTFHVFYEIDTMDGINSSAAKRIATVLTPFLFKTNTGQAKSQLQSQLQVTDASPTFNVDWIRVRVPKQQNHYDCGLYFMKNVNAVKKRHQIKAIIMELAA